MVSAQGHLKERVQVHAGHTDDELCEANGASLEQLPDCVWERQRDRERKKETGIKIERGRGERQIDRQIHRLIDIQIDRQTDRQTDR